MPKAQEKELKNVGKQKGLKGDKLDAFVYGTMENQKKAKKAKMAKAMY